MLNIFHEYEVHSRKRIIIFEYKQFAFIVLIYVWAMAYDIFNNIYSSIYLVSAQDIDPGTYK